MFRKIKARATVATITAVAAITVGSAAPASAATNNTGTPVQTTATQPAPNQANKTWDNLTGTGSYFWWNVAFDAKMGALKA